MPTQSDLDSFVRLARRVKTAEGERTYKEPIGSLIEADADAKAEKGLPTPDGLRGDAKPVAKPKVDASAPTLERVQSLKQTLDDARENGGASAVATASKAFHDALRKFAPHSSPITIKQLLHPRVRGKKAKTGKKK
jgi:hypothetical protein